MHNHKKNEELQTRREFFRQTVRSVLPVLGFAAFGPSFLSSCSGSDENGCGDCSMLCSNNCGNASSNSSQDNNTNNTNNTDESNSNIISEASGSIDGYEYVELGLSVKWARYNYGAKSPEKKGALVRAEELPYGYIEPVSKNEGSVSGSSYDIAAKKWSSKWKMPTRSEIQELITNCKYSLISYNGTVGAKFVAKNGNSIFLPAAGSNFGNGTTGVGEDGDYWTGDIIAHPRQTCGYYGWFFDAKRSGYFSEILSEDKLSLRPVTNKSGSVNTCGGTCTANCANNTNGACSNCASNCSNGCKTQCDYNCANTCKTGCGGRCNTSCGGTCSYVSAGSGCSGCARNCYNQCYTTCDLACANNCQSSCVSGSK